MQVKAQNRGRATLVSWIHGLRRGGSVKLSQTVKREAEPRAHRKEKPKQECPRSPANSYLRPLRNHLRNHSYAPLRSRSTSLRHNRLPRISHLPNHLLQAFAPTSPTSCLSQPCHHILPPLSMFLSSPYPVHRSVVPPPDQRTTTKVSTSPILRP